MWKKGNSISIENGWIGWCNDITFIIEYAINISKRLILYVNRQRQKRFFDDVIVKYWLWFNFLSFWKSIRIQIQWAKDWVIILIILWILIEIITIIIKRYANDKSDNSIYPDSEPSRQVYICMWNCLANNTCCTCCWCMQYQFYKRVGLFLRYNMKKVRERKKLFTYTNLYSNGYFQLWALLWRRKYIYCISQAYNIRTNILKIQICIIMCTCKNMLLTYTRLICNWIEQAKKGTTTTAIVFGWCTMSLSVIFTCIGVAWVCFESSIFLDNSTVHNFCALFLFNHFIQIH